MTRCFAALLARWAAIGVAPPCNAFDSLESRACEAGVVARSVAWVWKYWKSEMDRNGSLTVLQSQLWLLNVGQWIFVWMFLRSLGT